MPRALIGAAAGGALAVTAMAFASTATNNELGVKFKSVAAGATTTVEIRLAPRRAFDSVTVEAASGVATLNPPCAFSNVAPGGTYSCRVELTGKTTDPTMTVNVVAQHAAANQLLETETHHFSVKNAAFVRSTKPRAASHHVVTEQPSSR
jgi:hypothetical protein